MSWYKKLPIIPCIKCIIYISQIPKLLWRESTVPSPASEEKLCLGIIEGMLYCLIVWYVRGSPFREEGCRMWKGGSQEDGSQRSRQRRFFAPDSDFLIIILILILIFWCLFSPFASLLYSPSLTRAEQPPEGTQSVVDDVDDDDDDDDDDNDDHDDVF